MSKDRFSMVRVKTSGPDGAKAAAMLFDALKKVTKLNASVYVTLINTEYPEGFDEEMLKRLSPKEEGGSNLPV